MSGELQGRQVMYSTKFDQQIIINHSYQNPIIGSNKVFDIKDPSRLD